MLPLKHFPPPRRSPARFQWEAVADIRLDLTGHVGFPPGCGGTLHSHPFWEIILIGSGSGVFRRGETEGTCAANEVLVLRPGEMHQFTAGPSEPMEQLYLGFSFHLAPPDWVAAFPPALPAGPSADLFQRELREIWQRLRQHGRSPIPEGLRARILMVISRAAGLIIAAAPAAAGEPARRSPPVQAAMDMIASNFHRKLSVPELARRSCLSPKYFGKLFKQATGQSVKEYHLRMRLLRARELMEDSGLSITSIAAQVGFENLSYFSRLFKREFRVPPRRAHRIPPAPV